MTEPGATFGADWLALREPADHRSRAGTLMAPLRRAWTTAGWQHVVDLGAGTGSTMRWLAPRLPGPQRWTLVDHDAALLERARPPDGVDDLEVERRVGDLADVGLEATRDADLVTASALLDLVGRDWADRWIDACREAGCGVLAGLTWDGTARWTPGDGDDAMVLELVHRHQRRDKGTGPALGPDGAATVRGLFQDVGFETHLAASPWVLTPDDRPLAEALLAGWVAAAHEADPEGGDRIESWADRRRATLASGTFRLRVGHLDLVALPPGVSR